MKEGHPPSNGWQDSSESTVQRGGARGANERRTASSTTASRWKACRTLQRRRPRNKRATAPPAMISSEAFETQSLQTLERSLAGTEVSEPLAA